MKKQQQHSTHQLGACAESQHHCLSQLQLQAVTQNINDMLRWWSGYPMNEWTNIYVHNGVTNGGMSHGNPLSIVSQDIIWHHRCLLESNQLSNMNKYKLLQNTLLISGYQYRTYHLVVRVQYSPGICNKVENAVYLQWSRIRCSLSYMI